MTWNKKTQEKSKDYIFFYESKDFFHALDQYNIDYQVIGSIAMQSFSKYFRRIPSDIDILTNLEGISILKKIYTNLIGKKGYYKLELENMKVHIIVDYFDVLCYKKEEKLFSINLEEVYCKKIYNEFQFITVDEAIKIPVPQIEYLLGLTLIKPIDTNSINDIKEAINDIEFNKKIFIQFINQNSSLVNVILYRLNKIIDLLNKKEKLWIREKRLLSIIEEIKEDIECEK